MNILEIKNLHVSVDGKEILKGLDLTLKDGVVHALMGPNGSGKTTLAQVLMGHPKYQVTKGKILFKGDDVTNLAPDERARKGIFLSFQYPQEIPGVTVSHFLRSAVNSTRGPERKLSIGDFKLNIQEKMKLLSMKSDVQKRYLNEGFSGGEKKRAEILQLLMLDPTLAILDETDSGLDIDALKVVSQGVNAFMKKDKCLLIITHYKRILEYVKPSKVFIMIDGKIAQEGDGKLVDELEKKGYGWITHDQK